MSSTKTALLALLTLGAPPALAQTPATPLVVTTDRGAVRGVAADGVESWKGIPFAAPPAGGLRWRMPQPA